MKALAVAASLALVLSAAPVFAQAGQGARPAQPAPTAPAPTAQTAPAPPPQPPAPFPQGAKIAFVNLQAIAQLSGEGKAATAKVQALIQKKQNEATAKQKALADNQNKVQSGTLNDAARAALEKEIERQNTEAQRFQQDAQTEINDLNQQLQNEFEQKLRPVLAELAKEKGIQVLLSATDAGLVWADAGLDLTMDAVKKLDSGGAAAAPKAAAPAPAPPKQ